MTIETLFIFSEYKAKLKAINTPNSNKKLHPNDMPPCDDFITYLIMKSKYLQV